MARISRKSKSRVEKPAEAARLSPLEYEVAVWVGRGARRSEIAERLGLALKVIDSLISSAISFSGCRNIAELERKFEPDWSRIDEPPGSRWEKVGGRWVLRGGDQARARAREAYMEMKRRDWKKALEKRK